MTLADTSVWIGHFRLADLAFVRLLRDRQILTHRFVIGELAMGSLRAREKVIADLDDLPLANDADHDEVMALVERECLFSRGLSWIDAHLLASTLITPGARLWTHDRRLQKVAAGLGIAAEPVY